MDAAAIAGSVVVPGLGRVYEDEDEDDFEVEDDGDGKDGGAVTIVGSLLPGATHVSDWWGGDRGDECALACDSRNITDGWRNGGLVQSVLVSSGQRVDRLELARCSEDLEV